MPHVIERYTLPEMGQIWSDQRKLEMWKEVETLALEAWADLGRVPEGAVTVTRAAAGPTPEDVAVREKSPTTTWLHLSTCSGRPPVPRQPDGSTTGSLPPTCSTPPVGVVLSQAADVLLDFMGKICSTWSRSGPWSTSTPT